MVESIVLYVTRASGVAHIRRCERCHFFPGRPIKAARWANSYPSEVVNSFYLRSCVYFFWHFTHRAITATLVFLLASHLITLLQVCAHALLQLLSFSIHAGLLGLFRELKKYGRESMIDLPGDRLRDVILGHQKAA